MREVIREEAEDLCKFCEIDDIERVCAIMEKTVVVNDDQKAPIVYGQEYYPDLSDAIGDSPFPLPTVKLFERSNLKLLGLNVESVIHLSDSETPFLSLEGLTDAFHMFRRHLLSNEENLLQSGMCSGKYKRDLWLKRIYDNLYPIEKLEEQEENIDPWEISNLSDEASTILEPFRERLLRLKVQVLEGLERHVTLNSSAETLRYEIIRTLFGTFSWEEIIQIIAAESTAYEVVKLGGLHSVIKLVGFTEKELAIGTYTKAWTGLDRHYPFPKMIDSYYDATWLLEIDEIDSTLEKFRECCRDERSNFWPTYGSQFMQSLRENKKIRSKVSFTGTQRAKSERQESVGTKVDKAIAGERDANKLAKKIDEKHEYLFTKIGYVWLIRFHGVRTILKNIDGLGYLQILLKNSNQEIFAHDLLRTLKHGGVKSEVIGKDVEDQMKVENQSLDYDGDPKVPIFDDEMIKQIGDRIQYLEAKYKIETDGKKRVAYHDEVRELKEYRKKNVSEKKVSRTIPTEHERARSTITKRITAAITVISREIPDLGVYLRSRIKTGNSLQYKKDSAIDWKF